MSNNKILMISFCYCCNGRAILFLRSQLFWNWRPAVTLTFDLQNLIKSSVGDSESTLSVLSKLFKPFMRYCDNNICLYKQTNDWENRTAQKHNAFSDSVGSWKHKKCVCRVVPDGIKGNRKLDPPSHVLDNSHGCSAVCKTNLRRICWLSTIDALFIDNDLILRRSCKCNRKHRNGQ